ncbi:hypothetical protein DL770_001627 [Monosporascus sp. CRB-9-2]|nr:hypothetical protein DL770_001627 [Monosporascus sp. CRB-9-2]
MLFLVVFGVLMSAAVGLPSPRPGDGPSSAIRNYEDNIMRAQFDFKPFSLTDLSIDCMKDTPEEPKFECAMEFDWENPNANKSGSCHYSWEWDGVTKEHGDENGYNVEYYRCIWKGPEFFQFYFESMVDYSNFSLRMSHKFKDADHFHPPEFANMFAEGNFTLHQTENTTTSIIYAAPGPFDAPFKGMTI